MKKKTYKILIVALLMIGVVFYYKLSKNKSYINDYYLYINREKLDTTKIEEGEVGWSVFSNYQDEVDEEVKDILTSLIKKEENHNIWLLNQFLTDTEKRNKTGLGVLEHYIKLIDSSTTIKEFVVNTSIIEKDLSLNIFLNPLVSGDLKNTQDNIIYFMPVTFDFGTNANIYNDEDYSYYVALIKQYQIKIMKEYGYDTKKAREISRNIFNWEKSIAEKSKPSSTLEETDELYDIINKKELQDIYSNIDIDAYLNNKGLANQEKFSIVDRGNYKALNDTLTKENLPMLKEYVKFRLIEEYSLYISTNYTKLVYELNNKLLGVTKDFSLEDNINTIFSSYYNDILEKEYVNRYFAEKEKDYIDNMIQDIITYYKSEIKTLPWMSDYTKEKAIRKLDKMKINVGYPESFDITSKNYVIDENKTLIENMIAINKYLYEELIKLYTDKKEWQLSLTTVNAYYNPQDNSINFPAAFNKFVDMNKSYYENLGTVGMVIAHEITHAFDNNGAKFDENGNLNNWWQDDDYSKFKELQEKVEKYYGKYKILGLNVNGEKTVGENIADLGAIKAISAVAKNKGAKREDMKDMYSSFASMWASAYIESYQKLLLISDRHSPSIVRVNATLASCDEFYDTYQIKKNDKMYIDKKDRVSVW